MFTPRHVGFQQKLKILSAFSQLRKKYYHSFFRINNIDIGQFFNYHYGGLNCGITRYKPEKIYMKKIQWLFLFCYIEIKDKADTFDIVYISQSVVHAKITPKKAKSCIAITASSSSQNHNLYHCNFPPLNAILVSQYYTPQF